MRGVFLAAILLSASVLGPEVASDRMAPKVGVGPVASAASTATLVHSHPAVGLSGPGDPRDVTRCAGNALDLNDVRGMNSSLIGCGGWAARDLTWDPVCESTPRAVELVYGATDERDNLGGRSAQIKLAASDMDQRLAEEGRRVRFVCDNDNLKITRVYLGTARSLSSIITVLGQAGLNDSTRQYLVFVEGDNGDGNSGVARSQRDDSPDPATNLNANRTGYAAVYSWGGGTALHELLHTLGAVQPGAPHYYAYNGGHCWDGRDVMCYGPDLQIVCDAEQVDCMKNDYFNISPPPGNYLATHWNTANHPVLKPTG